MSWEGGYAPVLTLVVEGNPEGPYEQCRGTSVGRGCSEPALE